jgi:hypothetical protein
MQCLQCGGAFEWAGNGQYARCVRCLSLYTNKNGQLTQIVVQAPGGGHNPEFNAMFAKNLGFGPPPTQHPPGSFDMGDGYRLQVTIDGKDPEKFAKDEVKSMIWGWIIGGAILLLIILIFAGVGIYVYVQAQDGASGGGGPAAKTASAGAWDGKSTFECKGNDAITLTGVTASAGVKASANCQLNLVNVNITAPVGIDASGNAQVTMTGGSVNGSTNSVSAQNNAKVNLVGTKVTGKSKKAGAATINGAP